VNRDLFESASPACAECASPVMRAEHSWRHDGSGWRPRPFVLVCGNGHRVAVETPSSRPSEENTDR
jgi:hypothetical protein